MKPKPRPPSGRSTAQARTSSRPLASTMCWYGPRGEGRRALAGLVVGLGDERSGVTPFISGRKRMLKYHSSRTANGLTPRVIGCSGRFLNLRDPVRVGREAGFVVAADPVEELVAGLPLGDLDGVVQADQAHALVHQLLEWSRGGRPGSSGGRRRRP